jgi:arginine repressor
MIKFDDSDLVIHDELTKDEAIVFCKFLIAESNRHTEDIRKINDTISYLENKFSIDINMASEKIELQSKISKMIEEIKIRKLLADKDKVPKSVNKYMKVVMVDNEERIYFNNPFEGIEKVSDREFILHNYRGNIHLPVGTIIVARNGIIGPMIDIDRIVIESISGSTLSVDAVRSITGAYFLLKDYTVENGYNIRILTEQDMGDQPSFSITYEN